jgi:hypothetical protein
MRGYYPDLDPPAWTVLLRAAEGQKVTQELAAGIVGPDLAAPALAQLQARHLLAEGHFTALASRFRLWDRQAQAKRAGPPSPPPLEPA